MDVSAKNEPGHLLVVKKHRKNQPVKLPETSSVFVFSLFKQPGRIIAIFASN